MALEARHHHEEQGHDASVLRKGSSMTSDDSHSESLNSLISDTRAIVDGRPAPDLTASIMRAIDQVEIAPAALERGPLGRMLERLWTSHEVSLRVRPVYGLLAAAALIALVAWAPDTLRSRSGDAALPSSTEQRLLVQFRLEAGNASSVQLAGSFTNWQPQYELHESSPGIWTITLPLPLGVHDYAFVVDGKRWLPDPYAQTIDDGFGGKNSRIALMTPESPRS